MGNQKDVDDLFAQMSGEAEPRSDAEKAAAENKAAAVMTAEPHAAPTADAVEAQTSNPEPAPALITEAATQTAAVAPPVAPSTPKTMKGVWGSEPEPRFVKVSEALDDRMLQLEKRMRVNEDLMMSFIFHDKINEAYYRLWRMDANDYFRCLCTVKHRVKKARELEAQIEASHKTS